jgi:alpha-beta hydrolase superfamily lysophospholipase
MKLSGDDMKKSIRERDGQQWIYDWMLKTTGRAIHFEMDGRNIPPQAKSIKMVAKYFAKEGGHSEKLARAAESAGDKISARALYRHASEHYREAQHFVVPALSPKRWELYAKCRECAERLYSLMDYPIELVEVPYGGGSIPGVLHLQCNGKPAPTVVFIPGMDNTKENYPNPLDNEMHMRGMNVLAIDGPGQGEALQRGIYVNAINHVAAATASFEFLAARDDVDEKCIGLAGRSFGTFWAMRAAADEPRYAAVAGAIACYYWDRLTIFDEAPIRFKQVFMGMAGMEDEAKFDVMCEDFTLKNHAARILCPVLMATGEFDPLNPLEDAESVFEALSGPKEMWIFEDEFHPISAPKALGGHTTFHFLAEWMRRALAGEIKQELNRKTLVHCNGDGLFE